MPLDATHQRKMLPDFATGVAAVEIVSVDAADELAEGVTDDGVNEHVPF
jgi:hypothetical protein